MSEERVSLLWVKLWCDLLADPTIQRWSPTQRWCWVGSLLIAAQAPTPGHLTDSSGAPLSVANLRSLLNVSWHAADDFVEVATAAGKLVRDSSGALRVAKWSKRQDSKVGALITQSLGPIAETSRDRRAIVAPSASGHLKDRARASEAESEADPLSDLRAVEPRDAGPRLPVSIHRLEELADGLRGADQRTPRALASVLRGLSEHDLVVALERMRRAGPRNEAAYLVATLKKLGEEKAA